MAQAVPTHRPPDQAAPSRRDRTGHLRGDALEALSNIRTDPVVGHLLDAGIVEEIEIRGARAELALRPIHPVSRKAGGPTHQLWERIQTRLEKAQTSDLLLSVRIAWDRPWSP